MKIHFYKYQGAGNDFIIIDGRKDHIELSHKEIQFMCNRRFGIGADGLMIIGSDPSADFTMHYYNADGKEGTMCGNGGRCLVACAASKNVARYIFSAIDGIHHAEVITRRGCESLIRLGMNNVDQIDRYYDNGFYLNTGSPHLVLFESEVSVIDVALRGALLRNHPDFAPKGTNVNFVEIKSDNALFVRTFERGVEEETFSCGTGVTAAAIAAHLYNKREDGNYTYHIYTLGGDLQLSFTTKKGRFYDVQLTGPATFVFEGEWQKGRKGDPSRQANCKLTNKVSNKHRIEVGRDDTTRKF